ncbi:hypothetical protein YA0089_25905 [Pseudomonas viridiflava]|uniref:hypothetical protein n=1 Tax=Pseudomonas viridiflava TaxID=33069 RepID=UPI0018E611E0|nr:hypothetical protein [Pseudomonas viridiflava]MBI6727051.1 hypothetical protein [Pseudomonas viridiflava]
MKKLTGSIMAFAMGFSVLSASYAMADSTAPTENAKIVLDGGKGLKHDGPGHGRRSNPFAELNLSAEQKAKLKEIRERHSSGMREEALSVLTAEQKEKFKEHRKNRPKPPELSHDASDITPPPPLLLKDK